MADQVFGVRSGFWDAVDSDRVYTAEDMNKPYSRVVADGVFAANDGSASSDLQVVATGINMNLTVLRGQAIVGAKWFELASPILITVPANPALYGRIDSVIMQIDRRESGRAGAIVYRTGTAAQTPAAPAINETEGVLEYRIANVRVAPSAFHITQTDVTDLRGSADCPWVTSLIQQVDTSTLWLQFQDAYARQYDRYAADYRDYIAQQRAAWDAWLETLTDELTVSTNFTSFLETYTTAGTVTNIPIGIAAYDPDADVLQVYINGLLAAPGEDYELADDRESIDLTAALEAGQTVVFVCYKSIVGADIASAVSLIQRVEGKVDGFMADSGWSELILEGSVQAYSDAARPMGRVIGGRVYLRGMVKNISSPGTLICTLPVGVRPGADVIYSTAAVSTGGTVKPVTITVTASSGAVKLSYGSTAASDRIILTHDFLADVTNDLAMVFRYRGTVSSYAALPTSGMEAGDYYVVEAGDPSRGLGPGDAVLWNGAEWQVMSAAISSWQIDQIIDSIV